MTMLRLREITFTEVTGYYLRILNLNQGHLAPGSVPLDMLLCPL